MRGDHLVNALSLCHDLKARGVILEVQGEHLRVDAPVGVVAEEDRTVGRVQAGSPRVPGSL
jgi:hypothetical protein